MSVSATLQDMFSVPELTVPVQLGGASTRGFLDSAGGMIPLSGTEIQRIGTVLFLRKDSLLGLTENVTVAVGALGAASAVGGKNYRVGTIDPVDDGLIVACPLSAGR